MPIFDPALDFAFDDDEVQLLARLEHERWVGERMAQGFKLGPVRGTATSGPGALGTALGRGAAKNMQAVRRIPGMLARVGFQVLRNGGEG